MGMVQIVFPVENDATALEIKAALEKVLTLVPRVKFDFRLSRMRDSVADGSL